MDDLTQRLSDATEGTRELDALIARHLAGDPKDHWFDLHGVWSSDDTVPAFTTSLDAALALAERLRPCWSWSVGRNVHSQYWLAYALGLDDDRAAIQMMTATAMTASLALCLAILSAKATDTGVVG